jgi:hypothetical protein
MDAVHGNFVRNCSTALIYELVLQPENMSRLWPVEIYTPCLESISITRLILEKVDCQRHILGWQVSARGGAIKMKREWKKEKSNCETEKSLWEYCFCFSLSLSLLSVFISFFCFYVKLLPWCFNINQQIKKNISDMAAAVFDQIQEREAVFVFWGLYCSLHWIRVLPMLHKHNCSLNGRLHLSRQMSFKWWANFTAFFKSILKLRHLHTI